MDVASVARIALLIGSLFLAACDVTHSEQAEKGEPAAAPPPPVVQTTELKAAQDAVKLAGIATVLNPDTLLQLDADIRSAMVASTFSRGQLERFKASTLLSKQMLENAIRQDGIDASQLKLLQSRLQQTWGDEAPFLSVDARQELISQISSGMRAIVRFDFPDLTSGQPKNVRVIPLHGGTETPVETIWAAPSGNLAMPGVSFFGIIPAGPGLRAGDRARLIADNPDSHPGVVIPSAAIVVFASQSWCYVETAPKTYARKLVPLDTPVDDGYLVRTGFEAGTRVVIRGASTLLSREAQPGSLDDDDGGGSDAAPAGNKPAQPDDDKPAASAAPKPATSAAVQLDHSASHSDPD